MSDGLSGIERGFYLGFGLLLVIVSIEDFLSCLKHHTSTGHSDTEGFTTFYTFSNDIRRGSCGELCARPPVSLCMGLDL